MIELRGVSKSFGATHAVKDVSFTVSVGTALGIVGESGSGKTTVARMIVGAETPTSGEILIAGEKSTPRRHHNHRLRLARQVQMVFQDPYTSLDPRQSPRQSLDEVQRVHFKRSSRERSSRGSELLDAVGLGEREMRAAPRDLSGGQRQRAAIARALAAEPRLLVLDEALSALDVSVQAQILNLLTDLRSQFNLTYILISHDLAVIRQLCDGALVMYRGEEMESGPVDAVLDQPKHPYTMRLLESIPRPGMPLPIRSADLRVESGGCAFRTRCPHAIATCSEVPPLMAVGAQHAARCWLAERRDGASPEKATSVPSAITPT